MNENELKAIIEQVVKSVLEQKQAVDCSNDGRPKALVVGNAAEVPEKLSRGYVLCPLTEYENSGNILRYQRVIISNLSLLQLSDISLGRPGDKASCAVLQALLNGIETVLIEDGLPYKKYSGRCSTKLYAVLENSVKVLESFGVKTYTQERLKTRESLPSAPARFQKPLTPAPRGSAMPNPDKLITEERAKELTANGGSEAHLPLGAILTPSARDVFARAHMEIKKDM